MRRDPGQREFHGLSRMNRRYQGFDGSQPNSPALRISGDYELLPGGLCSTLVAGTSQAFAVANVVRVLEFHLGSGITFTRVTIDVTTTSNGNHEVIGIYNLAGQLLQQWTFTLGAGVGNLTIVGPALTLAAGTDYYLARATDNIVSVLQGFAIQAGPLTQLNGGLIPRNGTGANPMAALVLPATLGVITSNTNNAPLVLIES